MRSTTRVNSWPFAFSAICINDLNNVSKFIDLVLLVDDTNLFLSHKDPNVLVNTLNSELEKLSLV